VELLLLNKQNESVTVHTPKGEDVNVPVILIDKTEKSAEFKVIKDSGDDPDVTDGTEICVKAEIIEGDANFLAFSRGNIYIDGGVGVGRVTKGGLEQNIGQSAINKVPRDMMFKSVEKIAETADFKGKILVTVNVPNGEELAKKTFNPRLGIEGGISILGTSGIIEPMSEKAIIDTIETEIRQKSALGCKNLLVTPGNYGKSYVEKYLHIDMNEAVKCSNYIGEMLDFAVRYKFEKLLLVGNIGKLCKIALGVMNTHSKVADGRCEVFALHAVLCGADKSVAEKIMQCINTEEMLDVLNDCGLKDDVVKSLCSKISYYIGYRTGNEIDFGVMLFSEKYGFLGQTDGTEKILEQMNF
jgi:cobalt-precorrin-5B (C1)-methyltransferase